MAAAIETLSILRGNDRSIVVLGDMFELGSHSEEYHRALGEKAAASGADRVYATGAFAETVAAGAREKGMTVQQTVSGSREEILVEIKHRLSPGDWVLVKGSRAAGMEKIVSDLTAWAGGEKEKDEGSRVTDRT
jgi:UDP-N-acetylmuramoyl-tripeptide--D-alanyl-D-alanine ligase